MERPRRESRQPSVLHRADTNLSKNTTLEQTTMEQGTARCGRDSPSSCKRQAQRAELYPSCIYPASRNRQVSSQNRGKTDFCELDTRLLPLLFQVEENAAQRARKNEEERRMKRS